MGGYGNSGDEQYYRKWFDGSFHGWFFTLIQRPSYHPEGRTPVESMVYLSEGRYNLHVVCPRNELTWLMLWLYYSTMRGDPGLNPNGIENFPICTLDYKALTQASEYNCEVWACECDALNYDIWYLTQRKHISMATYGISRSEGFFQLHRLIIILFRARKG